MSELDREAIAQRSEISRQHELIKTLIASQTEALKDVCDALHGPQPEPRAEIREEMDTESRTITVHPCPRCGNSDPDLDASMCVKIRELAERSGWDGMSPLIDWLDISLTELQSVN